MFRLQMNFKKRLVLLCAAVIVVVPYFYHSSRRNTSVSGPSYVDGWNVNTSKRVTDYVSETLAPSIMPKKFCSRSALLLVIVNVSPERFEARRAIRESWARKHPNSSFYFLVGEEKTSNFEIKLKLEAEAQRYNDIIQEHFLDSYNNLTLKSINMLKLFTLHCSKSYKYLLKIDDDVFLNVDNVVKMLASRNSTTDFLVGKLINDTKPFRDPTSKWYVPYELYPEEKYPDYLCGPAYVMSSDVAEKLYRCALQTPIFHIEDAYITGICAKKMNITPRHHPLFTCATQSWHEHICFHKNVITLHYYEPDTIRKSYKILKEDRCPSRGSFMELIYRVLPFVV